MKPCLRVLAASLALLTVACAGQTPAPSLEGRWRVQMTFVENWSKRSRPLRTEVSGEMIFDRRLPDLPWWERQEYLGPRESGCSYLPINGFYGDTTPQPHEFDAAAGCPEAIAHRSHSDSVWVGINTRVIDAGTFLRGVLQRDTVRGSWYTGSQSLRQGGTGVFKMWRVSAPPPSFTQTVRRVQLERFSENLIAYAYEFFDPLPEYSRWIVGGFALLVAAVLATVASVTRGRGRLIGCGIVGAAALLEVMLTRAGRVLVHQLQGDPGFSLQRDAAQIGGLLLVIFGVVPALLVVAIRWNARRAVAKGSAPHR